MAESDDTAKPTDPAPTPNDQRELGYGNVDARADIDGDDSHDQGGKSEIDGQMVSGGESGGDAYPDGPTPGNQDGDHAGQSNQGYSGSENPNSTSTKEPK